jgi:hypothetical protein
MERLGLLSDRNNEKLFYLNCCDHSKGRGCYDKWSI